jgi:signal transduction histidine kinase
LGIGCVANAILQSNNGNLWIGTNGGLTTFNPAAEIKDTLPPRIQITAVKLVNDNIDWTKLKQNEDTLFMLSNGTVCKNFRFDSLSRWYNLPQHLSLAYNNNYISFDFAGIDMEQPQNIKYQYRLAGIDKSMSGLTARSGVSYGNLPPGDYTFIVRAMNSEGYWSNDYKYNFTIQHPWWGTWWFRLLAVISFIGFVFLIVRFIFKQQLRKQKVALEKQLAVQFERQRISADLHDEIGATLSSINIYAGLAKKEANGSHYLDSINQNVNEVIAKLDDLVWSISPRHDSLSSVIERIRSYAVPLARAKSISLHIENKMPDINAGLSADTKNHLYLIVKELVNNAIKHSFCQNMHVAFSVLKSSIVLTVEDDGAGFSRDKANPLRSGLHNITNRVNSIKGTINIAAEEGKGTNVTVTIPFMS